MYGASVTLGFGGSTLLVTVLTMLADLIGDNVVRTLQAAVDVAFAPIQNQYYLH